MFLSDSLPSEIRFRQAYTLSFYLSVMGRVSPVPNHTFHTYRFLYTEGFLRAAFQFLRTFHGFHPYAQGSASLCSLFRDLSNDTAEFTLCYGLHNCSPLLPRLLYCYPAPLVLQIILISVKLNEGTDSDILMFFTAECLNRYLLVLSYQSYKNSRYLPDQSLTPAIITIRCTTTSLDREMLHQRYDNNYSTF